MRLLLDTHAFLWFVGKKTNLDSKSLEHINDPNNDIFLSIASVWEIAIKVRLGKLQVPQPFEPFITNQLRRNRINSLDITIAHTALIASMPLHHRDPFDRLLIAQAIIEQMPIISADEAFDAYGITRLR
ncbi:MAG TPA: type II toxin-antitoxin system VapC family toxin [Chloroflexia bacterium]|jgi:PIN domain nuclease of toxin-antitoxin system